MQKEERKMQSRQLEFSVHTKDYQKLMEMPYPTAIGHDLLEKSKVNVGSFYSKTTYPQPQYPPTGRILPAYKNCLSNCVFQLPEQHQAIAIFSEYPVPGQEQSRVSYFVQCLDFKLKDIVVRFVGEKDVTSVTFTADVALTDRSTIYALVEYANKLDHRQREENDFNTNIPTTVIYSHFEGVTTLPITMLPLRLTRLHLDWVITTTNTYWCWTLKTGKGHCEYDYLHQKYPIIQKEPTVNPYAEE